MFLPFTTPGSCKYPFSVFFPVHFFSQLVYLSRRKTTAPSWVVLDWWIPHNKPPKAVKQVLLHVTPCPPPPLFLFANFFLYWCAPCSMDLRLCPPQNNAPPTVRLLSRSTAPNVFALIHLSPWPGCHDVPPGLKPDPGTGEMPEPGNNPQNWSQRYFPISWGPPGSCIHYKYTTNYIPTPSPPPPKRGAPEAPLFFFLYPRPEEYFWGAFSKGPTKLFFFRSARLRNSPNSLTDQDLTPRAWDGLRDCYFPLHFFFFKSPFEFAFLRTKIRLRGIPFLLFSPPDIIDWNFRFSHLFSCNFHVSLPPSPLNPTTWSQEKLLPQANKCAYASFTSFPPPPLYVVSFKCTVINFPPRLSSFTSRTGPSQTGPTFIWLTVWPGKNFHFFLVRVCFSLFLCPGGWGSPFLEIV